ncbi:hypothetical protein HaLaN_01231, partial [Haematococcus lacustris]
AAPLQAEFSGEVVKVLLENGSPVTVGTALSGLAKCDLA